MTQKRTSKTFRITCVVLTSFFLLSCLPSVGDPFIVGENSHYTDGEIGMSFAYPNNWWLEKLDKRQTTIRKYNFTLHQPKKIDQSDTIRRWYSSRHSNTRQFATHNSFCQLGVLPGKFPINKDTLKSMLLQHPSDTLDPPRGDKDVYEADIQAGNEPINRLRLNTTAPVLKTTYTGTSTYETKHELDWYKSATLIPGRTRTNILLCSYHPVLENLTVALAVRIVSSITFK